MKPRAKKIGCELEVRVNTTMTTKRSYACVKDPHSFVNANLTRGEAIQLRDWLDQFIEWEGEK
jgi:hypothetical protein